MRVTEIALQPGETVEATARFSLLSETRIFLLALLGAVGGFVLRTFAAAPSGSGLMVIIMVAFTFYAATRGLRRAISLFVKFLAVAYAVDLVLDIQPWIPLPRHGMQINPITVLLGFCEKVAWLSFTDQPASSLQWTLIISRIGLLLMISGVIAAALGLIRARRAEAVVTDRRLIVRKGVVFQSETSIPLSAVVSVTARKGLACGSLKLGLKASSFNLEGLRKDDFNNLYHALVSAVTGGD